MTLVSILRARAIIWIARRLFDLGDAMILAEERRLGLAPVPRSGRVPIVPRR